MIETKLSLIYYAFIDSIINIIFNLNFIIFNKVHQILFCTSKVYFQLR